ncbi:MAG: cyclase [Caulobacter sp.]|nr:cyclase [Caulobacter sp.]
MKRAVEHRIGVQAPAEIVWEVVSDFPSWEAWNPFHPKMVGDLRIGSTLTVDIAIPGQPVQTITPVVRDWVPYEQLHWQTTQKRGFVTAIRYLEIESLGPNNCTFSNGELFAGLLVRWIPVKTRRALREGFTAMGEAVRDRAEALWKARQGSAT